MGQSRLARSETVEVSAAMIRAIGGGQNQPGGLTFILHPAIQKPPPLNLSFYGMRLEKAAICQISPVSVRRQMMVKTLHR